MTDHGPRPISETPDELADQIDWVDPDAALIVVDLSPAPADDSCPFILWPTVAITNSNEAIQHYRKLLDDVWTVLEESGHMDVSRDPSALQDLINRAQGMIEEGTANDDYEDSDEEVYGTTNGN